MGPESKIEFTGGTLYFGDHDVDVKSLYMTDFESVIDATDDFHSITKIVNQPFEFEATCEIKFRGLVKLLGFWPAVKYEMGRLMIRIKRYFKVQSPSGRY